MFPGAEEWLASGERPNTDKCSHPIRSRFWSHPARRRLHTPHCCVLSTRSLLSGSLHSTPSLDHSVPHSRPTFHLVTLRCSKQYSPHLSAFPPLGHCPPANVEFSLARRRSRCASHQRGTQPTICCPGHRFRSVFLSFGERRNCLHLTFVSPLVSHFQLSCLWHLRSSLLPFVHCS